LHNFLERVGVLNRTAGIWSVDYFMSCGRGIQIMEKKTWMHTNILLN